MKDRVVAYDFLNILACMSVIFLHHSGIVHHYNGQSMWFCALAVECIFYFAVPCFFMLTGATLMRYDNRYSTKTFFRKRLSRTVIPFILWSCIWLLLNIIKGDVDVCDLAISQVLDGIINTRYQPIYWFFIPLFVCYLLLPMLVKAKDDTKLIKYLIFLFFTLGSCVPLLSRLLDIQENAFLSNAIFGPLMYLLCGYYFSRNRLKTNEMGGLIFVALISLLVRYFVTMNLSLSEGQTNKILFGYYLPTAVFPSLCVFILIVHHNFIYSDRMMAFLKKISSLSLGVYLLHKLVMFVELRALQYLSIDEDSLFYILLMPFVTWLICVMIVSLVKKVKLLNFIFP